MTDYFGYDVHFVMNVTDIDDKVCHQLPMQHKRRLTRLFFEDHR
jgi:cysteinyl-tRNA synthetase